MKNIMEYNFDVSSIELSCYVAPGCGTPVHKNRSSHGIAFHPNGIKNYTFDGGRTFKLCENEILYIPKYSNYTVDSLEQGGCYAINFHFFTNTSFLPYKFKVKNQKNFISLFQSATEVWSQKEPGYELKSKAILYSIFYEMKKEYEIGYISKSKINLIKPAINYIHEEYTNENINISYLSELCDISEAYFRRIFFKSFGVSPIKYINTLKIERAKELINSGMYSINEAATESGFHDDAYFSRKFKEVTGYSPSEYKLK